MNRSISCHPSPSHVHNPSAFAPLVQVLLHVSQLHIPQREEAKGWSRQHRFGPAAQLATTTSHWMRCRQAHGSAHHFAGLIQQSAII